VRGVVISNPALFPTPRETDALWTHVDLLPALADLAGADPMGVGRSQLPVLLDPGASVQDDVRSRSTTTSCCRPTPGMVAALRDERWTYAVYFDATAKAFEYELYDNDTDLLQFDNLVFDPSEEIRPIWRDLHARLLARLASALAIEESIVFPPIRAPSDWSSQTWSIRAAARFGSPYPLGRDARSRASLVL
jgi:choline-sulfatase